MIFRPDLVARFKSCGVSVLNSWVDMLPITSGYLDRRSCRRSLPPGSSGQGLRVGQARHPPSHRYGYYDQLARGELCLAVGYSADAMVARRLAAQLGNGVRIEYSHPTETVQLYIDAYAIPASAKHWEAALRFIDFTLRPEIGVEIAHATGFAVANSAAIDRLEPELRDNHIVYRRRKSGNDSPWDEATPWKRPGSSREPGCA